jgi:MFS family permease
MHYDYRKIIPISLVYMGESISLNAIYPIIPFLLLQYKAIPTIESAGLYSGLFSSLYFTGQFLCNIPFGNFSDKFGRRNLVLCGVLILILLNIFLGISNTLYLTLAIRFLQGFLDPCQGLCKSYINDISDQTTISSHYSSLLFFWGIGAIIGSTIGGYTYNISPQYPTIYTFAIVSMILMLIYSIIFGYLEETIENKTTVKEYISEIKCEKIYTSINTIIISIAIYLIVCIVDISISETSLIWMVSDKSVGGLNYDEKTVSLIYLISNFVGLLAIPIIFLIEQILPKIWVLKLSLLTYSILIFLIPFIKSDDLVLLCVFSSFRSIILTIIYNITFSSISLYNTTNIGETNGFIQSCSGLCKILAPIISTNIWYWSITITAKYWFIDYHFLTYILIIFVFFAIILAHILSKPICTTIDIC